MLKQSNLISFIIVVFFCYLAACTNQTTSDNLGTVTSGESLIDDTPTASVTITPIVTRADTAISHTTIMPALTPTLNPTATVTPFNTATRGVIQLQKCPTLVDQNTQLLTQGSILYNVGKIQPGYPPDDISVEEPGIWGFSSSNQASYQVHETVKWGWISPDGIFLLSLVPDLTSQSTTVTFFNLETEESYDLMIPRVIEQASPEWLPNGNVQLKVVIEHKEGVGESLEIFVFDPNTQQFEKEVKEISLPDFAAAEIGILPGVSYGYISVDPTNRFALYTTRQGRNQDLEIRLRDLQTNQIIWQQESGIVSAALPEWSLDGSRVLLDIGIYVEGENFSWSKLLSLNMDGHEEDLPPQPLPFADKYLINQYSRSPDGRYIFYLILFSEGFNQTNRAFILDTETWQVSEICSLESTFWAYVHGGGTEVYWLPNDQLLYRALIDKDGQQTHSLRILDIPSWTAQILFEVDPGYGINVFGWTPIEYP